MVAIDCYMANWALVPLLPNQQTATTFLLGCTLLKLGFQYCNNGSHMCGCARTGFQVVLSKQTVLWFQYNFETSSSSQRAAWLAYICASFLSGSLLCGTVFGIFLATHCGPCWCFQSIAASQFLVALLTLKRIKGVIIILLRLQFYRMGMRAFLFSHRWLTPFGWKGQMG